MKAIRWMAFAGLVWTAMMGAIRSRAQELPALPALTKEELALSDNPAATGAAAMILYYGVETDNIKGTESYSFRLKVFRDEGKKYADIEIPYVEKESRVEAIRARTVGEDGKVVEFGDQIYDREIIKAKKYRMNAKVFTLPNVQVGSIIEYSYRLGFKGKIPDVFQHPSKYLINDGFTYPAARWTIQRNLFVRHGHFSLRPVNGAVVSNHFVAVTKTRQTYRGADGTIELDVDNVPAFEEEEYSPPEDTLKERIDLYYSVGLYGVSSYWTSFSKRVARENESFMKVSKGIEKEAARLVSGADTEEAKLRRIYERVQQVRLVNYEPEKTDKERKQENLKENKNVEDLLTRGYGYGNQANLLFVALARGAGFQAYPMMITSRRQNLFMEEYPSGNQLNGMVVQVVTQKKSYYFDPATKFCPFELLPWDEADAGGVRIDTVRPQVDTTPMSRSSDAVTRRKATLRLDADGVLRGKVEVEYLGQEGLGMRLEAMNQDEAARRKELEEGLVKMLGIGSQANLTQVEGWEKGDGPLKAVFEVEVPNFATRAGRRSLISLGVFHTKDSNPFPSPRRVNPVYFGYPQETHEDVSIEMAPTMKVESLPASVKNDGKAVYYDFAATKEGNTIHITRNLQFRGYLFERAQYSNLRAFYNKVLSGDSQQATLVTAEEKLSN
jgi:transglutaminase-like putative cysteine protease